MSIVRDSNRKPLGNYQSGDLSTAAGCPSLSSVENPRVALIQAVNNDVSWRDDGTTATNSSGGSFGGMILPAGDSFLYTGDLQQLSFIEATSTATAYINVAYYS